MLLSTWLSTYIASWVLYFLLFNLLLLQDICLVVFLYFINNSFIYLFMLSTKNHKILIYGNILLRLVCRHTFCSCTVYT